MSGGAFNHIQHPSLTNEDQALIRHITQFAEAYFQNPKFDSSHDFHHVMRVVRNAIHILDEESKVRSSRGLTALSARIIILGALLHDVGDRKYVDVATSEEPLAKLEMLKAGISKEEATIIQAVVDGVSYSSEIKAPGRVAETIHKIPELAVVQDADRLDAIGAIGIARCFTFGGACRARTLDDSVEHFSDKLLKLESMMKTETGKRMAAERSRRVEHFI